MDYTTIANLQHQKEVSSISISGLDIHKSRVWVHVLDHKGNEISERIVNRDPAGLETLQQLYQTLKTEKVVMESTSSYWIPVYRQLDHLDVDNKIVVNAYQMKVLGRHKTDKRDAKRLAQWGLLNVLTPSYVPSMELHDLRQLVRTRAKTMNLWSSIIASLKTYLEGICPGMTTALRNMSSNYARYYFSHWRRSTTMTFAEFVESITNKATKKALLRREETLSYWWTRPLTDVQQQLLDFKLRQLHFYNQEIAILDASIVDYVDTTGLNQAVALMTTIPGLGFITAATIAAELGSVDRYKNAREAAASCGLTPLLSGSAGNVRTGRVTKHGPKSVRRATYNVCKTVIRFCDELREFYERIVENKKGDRYDKRKAKVALSRKLVELCWTLWRNQTPYRPQKR